MKAILTRLPKGQVARGTLLVLFWQLCRMMTLGVWVIVAARAFGAHGYGTFAGVAGLATVTASLSGMGMGYLLYQQVAIDPDQFHAYWRKALFAYGVGGVALSLILLVVATAMFPTVGMRLVILIALSDVMAFPFISAAAYAFAAHERMGWSAALPAGAGVLRLGALMVFVALVTDPRIETYLWFHVAASVLAAVLALLAVQKQLAPLRSTIALTWNDLRRSAGFSVVWFTNGSLTSWDKALVLRLAGNELSGLYAAAYRFASLVATPMDALIMAATPRMFRHGREGGSDQGLVSAAVASIIAFGGVAAGMVWLVAPILPWLLGHDFAPSTDILRGIALMIPLYGLRQFGGHVLVTYDRRTARIVLDACALCLMTGLGILIIPARGLTGAVDMIVTTEAFLAVLSWILAFPTIVATSRKTAPISR
jgi:O-antigen/teichoic acid export membrane protein